MRYGSFRKRDGRGVCRHGRRGIKTRKKEGDEERYTSRYKGGQTPYGGRRRDFGRRPGRGEEQTFKDA